MNKETTLFKNGQRTTPILQKIEDLKCAIVRYNRVDTKLERAKIAYAYSVIRFIEDATGELEAYQRNLEQGECYDALPLSDKGWTDMDFWLNDDDRLKQEMYAYADKPMSTYDPALAIYYADTICMYRVIADGIERITELLKRIDETLKAVSSELYLNFYRYLRAQYCEERAVNDFEHGMKNSGKITFSKLQTMQIQVMACFINGGTLNCAPPTTDYERENVDFEQKRKYLPHEYHYEEWFLDGWAVLARTIRWEGDIVVPDYSCVGLFIFQRWEKLTEKDILSIFYLDKMLELIHKEMARMKPELGKYCQLRENESGGEDKDFAFKKNMKKMLRQFWFNKLRTDKRYDGEWIDSFVEDLMKSNWNQLIAEEWQKPDKRLSLKANIIGCLKVAGVIDGSNLSIASYIVKGDNIDIKTFASYIGRGAKRPFCEWIMEYAKFD